MTIVQAMQGILQSSIQLVFTLSSSASQCGNSHVFKSFLSSVVASFACNKLHSQQAGLTSLCYAAVDAEFSNAMIFSGMLAAGV